MRRLKPERGRAPCGAPTSRSRCADFLPRISTGVATAEKPEGCPGPEGDRRMGAIPKKCLPAICRPRAESGLCQAKERPEAFKPSDARLPMSTADRFSSPGSIPFRRWAFLVAPVRVHRRPTSRGMVLSVSSADRVSWRNPFHTTRPFRGPFHLHRWPLLIAACPCPPPTRFSWRGALSVSASDRSRSLGPCPCSPLTVSRHLSVFTTDRFPSRGVRVHDSPFSSRGPAMSTRDRCAVSAKFPFVITN